MNQKGHDFANDNQLTESETHALESQGMPTFTINRILPVVEMLNFYATANNPRWQAVGVDGSDSDVAALFSDLSDYIWANSDGGSIYANAVNDCITKSIGYIMVTVDKDADQGMGEVKLEQPEPFDLFVDPKSRDMLFRDAAYIMIRKILPKSHLLSKYPEYDRKIKNASGEYMSEDAYTEKATGSWQKDFDYKDIHSSESIDPKTAEHDTLIEYFELYEKIKVPYQNVFYRIPPDQETLEAIKKQVNVRIQEMQAEMQVELAEQQKQMQEAVQRGEMIQDRYNLEMEKAQKMMQQQLQTAEQEYLSQLQQEVSKVESVVVSDKEYKALLTSESFKETIVEAIKFHDDRIKQTCVIGDTSLFEKILPERIKDYPIVPFHFKWTGTPFPISAVSPLVGKQREMNKAHQIMVHNASLGSSLRWMHEEGSIDTDYWEQYSSSPGALLPIRPGAAPPTPVIPAPLSNAFFGIVQEGKQDMEYLAGIYGAMQGDTSSQHETYRGMLAMDEYGTRRVKQWMKNSIDPALKQLGTVVQQFSQSIYTAHKTFRIVQPNNLSEIQDVEMNIPMYNDYGEVIGKFKDYATAKFDIRVIAGSTLPINRWAYLDELKQYMQLGVIDDIAFLAETDVRNKEKIAQRKSIYSQLRGQIQGMEESIKDKDGTIETLERQLVQAGIKNKIMQASVEINKKKEEVKGEVNKEAVSARAQGNVLGNIAKNNIAAQNQQAQNQLSAQDKEADLALKGAVQDMKNSEK
tara:strand:- start:1081 stop:3324 length:2244 start_codon:yes stop_codon:yes gene_type:complete